MTGAPVLAYHHQRRIGQGHPNTARAITIALSMCTVAYLAAAGNLSLSEILAAEDFALAEAAPRPSEMAAFTVALAVVATASGSCNRRAVAAFKPT